MPELLPWKRNSSRRATEKGKPEGDVLERAALPLLDRVAPLCFDQSVTSYSLGEWHAARVWRVYDYVSPLSRERIEEFYALPFELRLAFHRCTRLPIPERGKQQRC